MPKKSGLSKKMTEENPLVLSNTESARDASRELDELAARELKIRNGLAGMDDEEYEFVFGKKKPTDKAKLEADGASVFKMHEKDLIYTRQLRLINQLPDSSADLMQWLYVYKCKTRQELAQKMADDEYEELLKDKARAILRKPTVFGGAGGVGATSIGTKDIFKLVATKGQDFVSKLF